jgi:hypothetical protein
MLNNLSPRAICQKHAAQCDRRAILTIDETVRQLYRELAEQWRMMASDAERLDRLSTIEPVDAAIA